MAAKASVGKLSARVCSGEQGARNCGCTMVQTSRKKTKGM